ncbi:MAG TPA: hypothetical protein VJY47_03080 [Candidatus Dojkabacteria bacterium]|nr:hypothetical protein [Candidatus Dojkabacteria bacterium]
MNLKNIIIMKVGPHSDMSLSEIIDSKIEEEKIHGVHFWGYSGVFCHPTKVQQYCEDIYKETGENPKLVLIETKSKYSSNIGFIKTYSTNGKDYVEFKAPVQLQGATYSFVCKNIKKIDNFCIDNYLTIGGKNNLKPLDEHLRYRVNKSFAKQYRDDSTNYNTALVVDLVPPYCI